MEEDDLVSLKDLKNRALQRRVLENGSDEVVIYASELHALERAIQELEKEPQF